MLLCIQEMDYHLDTSSFFMIPGTETFNPFNNGLSAMETSD